ncbi:hypothetical protein [Flavobacterium sp.]|uniref:OB-fold protein n=1 Tax=Flavobacterium sp. TaxID=239 RepID=UPI0025F353C4|nr:hypothetical protein [Flavobacterium sp.]
MRKKIIIAVTVLLILAFAAYKYMYKSHRDISTETVSYSASVNEVYNAFQQNDSLANAKYLDKTIEIYGKITNIDLSNKIITVDKKLLARFTNSIPNTLQLQNAIALKGRVVGFDDLLEEIQMDQCTIKQ